MGYTTTALVEQILANALTRGTSSAMPVPIINIGNQVRDTVGVSNMIQFVRWADEEIDAAMSPIYKVPLKRIVKGEFSILSDITALDTSFSIEDSTRFNIGDIVNITDRIISEKKVILTIPDETTITVTTAFSSSYLATNTIVQRVDYPDPIPLISARFAAANLYDKFFASQSSPNMSDYGKTLRGLGESDLNNVLNGRIRLLGERMIGRRFYNPNLLDANHVPVANKDRDKGGNQ